MQRRNAALSGPSSAGVSAVSCGEDPKAASVDNFSSGTFGSDKQAAAVREAVKRSVLVQFAARRGAIDVESVAALERDGFAVRKAATGDDVESGFKR